jgi:hypothetical protein
MEIYFDDWTTYILLKYHIQWIRMLLERCRKILLSLTIEKCIFSTPICILLGYIIFKHKIKFDMDKIKFILDLKPPVNKKQTKIFIGHTEYYQKFIQHYSHITFPINELLKKEDEFYWS